MTMLLITGAGSYIGRETAARGPPRAGPGRWTCGQAWRRFFQGYDASAPRGDRPPAERRKSQSICREPGRP